MISPSERGNALRSMRYALALTRATNPGLLGGVVVTGLARSLLPAGLAVVARGLLNSVAAAVRSGAAAESSRIALWVGVGLGITLISALGGVAYNYLLRRLQDEVDLEVSTRVLSHAAALEYERFENPRFQDTIQRVRGDSSLHFSSFLAMSLNLIANLVVGASLVAILAVIAPVLLLVLIPIAVPYFALRWFLARRVYDDAHARATKFRWNYYYSTRLTEPAAVAEVKLLDLAPVFISRFRGILAELRDRTRALARRELVIDLCFVALSTVAVYWVLLRVVAEVIRGGLTIGDVALFGGAAVRLRGVVQDTISGIGNVRGNLLHIDNLKGFFDLKPRPMASGRQAPAAGLGEVQLRDVSFTYPGGSQPALAGVSLQIRAGETVALVGENGAGKTTLAKLLVRFYDPSEGAVLLGGVDVRELPLDVVRQRISFVLQDFGRYEATAGENLAFGDWRRLLDRPAEIEDLAQRTGVAGLVDSLPRGYDTRLGLMFGEHSFSGGQWQQLALARAFGRDADLMILDEPTASLDARTEWRMFSRFKTLAQGRTTILISHRFSTVGMADRIIVMHQGRITESGTHAELLAMGGRYADLYSIHLRRMRAADDSAGDGEEEPGDLEAAAGMPPGRR